MAIDVTNKINCTGCAACKNICPQECITMEHDDCGFAYPKVEQTKCIDCGLCEKTCPLLDCKKLIKNEPINVYAAWSKNSELRYLSTSGGIFGELAAEILSRSGAVVGAAYGKNNVIEHHLVSDIKGVESSSLSCVFCE